jgi:hypothetical protein
MGITIMKEDVLANAVWKKILEENKWIIKANYSIRS